MQCNEGAPGGPTDNLSTLYDVAEQEGQEVDRRPSESTFSLPLSCQSPPYTVTLETGSMSSTDVTVTLYSLTTSCIALPDYTCSYVN